jgi:hypothetical protein
MFLCYFITYPYATATSNTLRGFSINQLILVRYNSASFFITPEPVSLDTGSICNILKFAAACSLAGHTVKRMI